jgi:4-amino-4-deoxy-L-arabinose transferase-like glycosyltransferase
MRHLRTARLAAWQTWLLSLSGTGLWLSGAAWLLLHYYGQVQGEFGLEMNLAEPLAMKVHGLVMIPALLGLGGLFVAHIPKGWHHRGQRVAGSILGAILIVLIASGYLLYYAGGEDLRAWTSLIHWAIGLGLPVVFVWHYVQGRRAHKRPAKNGNHG